MGQYVDCAQFFVIYKVCFYCWHPVGSALIFDDFCWYSFHYLQKVEFISFSEILTSFLSHHDECEMHKMMLGRKVQQRTA